MIPKVIHYCWFGGGKKNDLFRKCFASWKKYCPDYRIIEWNENNFDIDKAPQYVREAYQMKRWAFVTDYVRLKIVYDNGGIYLDTDVELRKPLDSLLELPAFFGIQGDCFVATGLGFGAEKGAGILKALIDDYAGARFIKEDGTLDVTDCPRRNTRVFTEFGFVQENVRQVLTDNTVVFEAEVFCPINYQTKEENITDNTISIHWYSESWKTDKRFSSQLFKKLFGYGAFTKVSKIKKKLFEKRNK